MDLLFLLLLVLVAGAVIVAFARFSWRNSEEEYRRHKARRGEDEDPDRFDDRGSFRSHWGGWGRPG